jgi:hypothetical protein
MHRRTGPGNVRPAGGQALPATPPMGYLEGPFSAIMKQGLAGEVPARFEHTPSSRQAVTPAAQENSKGERQKAKAYGGRTL